MTLTFLHTAEAHRATFDNLRDRLAPGAELTHVVREDWLAEAQNGIGEELAGNITQLIEEARSDVVCTCTTLGPTAAEAGAIRIDQPMMQAAAATTGAIIMAYCLNSTLGPSLDLLEDELAKAGVKRTVHPLPLNAFWPLFEAGHTEAFAIGIAGEIRQIAPALPDLGCVVLAQASMAGAAALLTDLDVPVLNSPELAFRAVLGTSPT